MIIIMISIIAFTFIIDVIMIMILAIVYLITSDFIIGPKPVSDYNTK